MNLLLLRIQKVSSALPIPKEVVHIRNPHASRNTHAIEFYADRHSFRRRVINHKLHMDLLRTFLPAKFLKPISHSSIIPFLSPLSPPRGHSPCHTHHSPSNIIQTVCGAVYVHGSRLGHCSTLICGVRLRHILCSYNEFTCVNGTCICVA